MTPALLYYLRKMLMSLRTAGTPSVHGGRVGSLRLLQGRLTRRVIWGYGFLRTSILGALHSGQAEPRGIQIENSVRGMQQALVRSTEHG